MIPTFRSDTISKFNHIKHAFCTRQGGVSKGYLSSLNTSYNKGEDRGVVDENRRRVCQAVDGELTQLYSVYQNHTTDVVTLSHPDQNTADTVADAIVSNLPNKILSINTADCAPVLFVDPVNNVIGAAHAGWRGAVGGILDNTLAAMIELGADISRVNAAIGPCIWQSSYEVGQDFYDQVLDTKSFFAPGARDNHWQFDLPGYILNRLNLLGITNVTPSPADTFSNPDMFFSYRRKTLNNEPLFGVSMSIIKIENSL